MLIYNLGSLNIVILMESSNMLEDKSIPSVRIRAYDWSIHINLFFCCVDAHSVSSCNKKSCHAVTQLDNETKIIVTKNIDN